MNRDKNTDDQELLAKVRSIAMALPGVTEKLSHGAPCFYVRKRPLCYFHDADFSSNQRTSLWCPAPAGDQDHYVQAYPDRYFAPTPSASGTFGAWVGAYLDGVGANAPNWDEIAELINTAFGK